MFTRRAYLIEPGKLEVRETELRMQPNELLLEVLACGLCTWELNHYQGRIGEAPMSLGHEFVGRVVDKGGHVAGFEIGDVVTGLPGALDGFSDYMTVAASNCEKVAPGIKPEHALGEPLKCVVTVLRGAAPEAGDYGVVIGAGPMGLWAIQALAGNSLSALIAVDVDEEKLKLAANYGATHTVNPAAGNAIEAIRAITRGHMADFVIEGTGNTKVINDGIAMLKAGRGRLVLMSSYKSAADNLDVVGMVERSVEIRVPHPGYSLSEQDDLRRAVQLLNKGVFRLEGIVSHQYSLNQIQQAFEALEKRPAGYLKGVVIPKL
ncbi:zinc-dependent alcohol dehydrogenase [Paenibacillus glycanilyticus]|uniref:Erythritol/L-threitol dehydrogenase n=1 Tax=Paenibacillus glycanilyticus TaxID=126569 RepID=A0ABQ6GMM3_9BACL|nr:zinc-binding dehydrogenase [Paenibacillus glycanilyticus]GLX71528.1 erythritol/L-threitol dehydrogenase [Paenibacillus glycanilyticus]